MSSEPPKRPILRLKPVAPKPPVSTFWKCKPCGGAVEVLCAAPPHEVVRCPTCNANLGKAGDFNSEPVGKVRARKV